MQLSPRILLQQHSAKVLPELLMGTSGDNDMPILEAAELICLGSLLFVGPGGQ
jgi:uncharacterized pyridoxal phosphate-containing UPF0001 family protein